MSQSGGLDGLCVGDRLLKRRLGRLWEGGVQLSDLALHHGAYLTCAAGIAGGGVSVV